MADLTEPLKMPALTRTLALYASVLGVISALFLFAHPVAAILWPDAVAEGRFAFLPATSLGAAFTAIVIALCVYADKVPNAHAAQSIFGFLFPLAHMLFMCAVTTIRWMHPELMFVTSACFQFSMIASATSFIVLVVVPSSAPEPTKE
jgi:hypothetical protein